MKTKLFITFFVLGNIFFVFSQQTYYAGIDFSQTGTQLRDALSQRITETHTNFLSYTPGIWNASKATDVNPDNPNEVLLVYGWENGTDNDSTNDRTRGIDNNGTGSNAWNREHIYPRSLGNPNLGTEGPGADAHHLRPCDPSRNSSRSNRRFADGSGNSGITAQGHWYPGDEWKGDVARMMLFMYLRYGDRCLPNNVAVGEPNASDNNMVNLLLEWNAEDPVTPFEDNRNNYHDSSASNAQGNRNPFIDNPYLATLIWGGPEATDRWGIAIEDNEAPTIPQNLVTTNPKGNSIDLAWDASTDNVEVAFYEVYVDGVLSQTVNTNRTTVEGLIPNTTYSFTVLAKDFSGNASALSEAVTGATNAIDIALINEDFDNCTTANPKFITYSEASDKNWSCENRGGQNDSGSYQINGFRETELSKDWLVTATPLDFDQYTNERLNLYLTYRYGSTPLEFIYSSDYTGSGNPALANWTAIPNVTIPTDISNDESRSTTYTNVDLSTITGQVYIAFKYYSDGNPTRWNIDNFKISAGDDLPVDTEAPSIPQNVSVSNSTTTSLEIAWEAATDNIAVTGYDVFVDGNLNKTVTNTLTTIDNLLPDTTYNISIAAKDAAGNTSTLSDVLTAKTQAENTGGGNGELFISEYVEGSGFNKAIEIANLTAAAIDLSQYNLRRQTNGAGDWEQPLNLSGTLASGDVYVIINTQAALETLVNEADLVANNVTPMNFNGNDPIGLFKGDELIDIVGNFDGGSGNFAKDITLRRKETITGPNTTFDLEQEWDSFGQNTVDNIGVIDTPVPTTGELFISEYVEGSSFNKAIEIANLTGAAIDLSQYNLRRQTNGAGDWEQSLELSGTLASGNVYVIINTQAALETLVNEADLVANNATPMNFNGNDPVGLFKGEELIDIVGNFDGGSGNFAKDITLRRKAGITEPNTTFDLELEWDRFDQNTVDNIGTIDNDDTSSPTDPSDKELFISEYVEGSGFNKTIEIANLTGSVVDLAVYNIRRQTNGAGEWETALQLSGTLANEDVFVITNSQADLETLINEADLIANNTSPMNFNGNDPVGLFKGDTLIDIVGNFDGGSGNFAKDVTLRRKIEITSPNTSFDLATEWDSFDQNTVENIGIINILEVKEIFFSEYIEGGSFNKAIEIANRTGTTVDLTAYNIRRQTNGAGTWETPLQLSGILNDKDVFVIINSQASLEALINEADLVASNTTPMNFNGNDPVGLFKGDELIDIIGTFDGGSSNFAKDVTLIRKSSITDPNLVFNLATEWDSKDKDTVDNIGVHFVDGDPDTIAPTSPSNLTIFEETPISFLLEWKASTDNISVTGYDIYLDEILYTTVDTTFVTINNLMPEMDYELFVVAKDEAGNTSTPSEIIIGTTSEDTPSIFISEYVEGTDNNKAIELANITGETIDLSFYDIRKQNNGTGNWETPLPLQGNLASGDVFVIANSDADNPTLMNEKNIDTNQTPLDFDGNDPIGLFKYGKLIDIVGTFDAGESNFAKDQTLRRKYDVTEPNSSFDLNGEWKKLYRNNVCGIGYHSTLPPIYDFLLKYKNQVVYPNPSKGDFKIYFKQINEVQKVIIYKGFGQIIYESEDLSFINNTLEFTNMPKGFLWIQIQYPNKTEIAKAWVY